MVERDQIPRLLVITPVFGPKVGGVQTMVDKLMAELPPSSAHVLAPDAEGAADWDAERRYQVTRQRPTRVTNVVASCLRLLAPLLAVNVRYLAPAWRIVRRDKTDVTLCAQLSMGPTALWCRLVAGVPYLILGHADELLPKPGTRGAVGNLVRRLVLSRCHRVLVNNGYAEQILTEHWGLSPDHIAYIPLAADPVTEATPRTPIDDVARAIDGKRVLLTVARLDADKGVDVVLDALPEIVERVPDVVYLVVGGGPAEDDLRGRTFQLGVEDRVVFAGQRLGAELNWCYDQADAFVLATRREAFGLVFLEAQAWGKPIVATRVGGVPEAVLEDRTGLLVERDDVAGLSRAVVSVLTDGRLARRFGQQGQERIATERSWAVSAARLGEATTDALVDA